MSSLSLITHPSASSPHVRSLDASIERRGALTFELRFVVEGHITRLRVPALLTPKRADNLWRHTCFEAFLRKPGGTAYCELNSSPSREWAAYRFDSYRAGMTPVELPPPPSINTVNASDLLEVTALVDVSGLSSTLSSGDLQVGLCGVVEDDEGRLSYWALRHPARQARFPPR